MISWDMHITRPGGIVIGGTPSIVIRELVLFTADLTRASWFRNCAPPPEAPLPGNVQLRWLPFEEWQANRAVLETDEETVLERYRAGARCLFGWDSGAGKCVYHLWVSETGAYIEWIFKYVSALPGHLLAFDIWVHPDCRGQNIHWVGAARACEEARRAGHPGIFAGIEDHEFPVFALKYARAGLCLIKPHVSLAGVKVFGATAHFTRSPSQRLVAYAERLKTRHPHLNGHHEHENSFCGPAA